MIPRSFTWDRSTVVRAALGSSRPGMWTAKDRNRSIGVVVRMGATLPMTRATAIITLAVAICGCGQATRGTARTEGTSDLGVLPRANPTEDSPRGLVGPTTGRGRLDRYPSLKQLRDELRAGFDARMGDHARYVREATAESRGFPEGDLFPLTFPAMAYSQLALEYPDEATELLERAPPLLDAAIEATARRVGTTPEGLLRLPSYQRHGCYLGQLNLALTTYRLASGDARYDPLIEGLSSVLHAALVEAEGRPIASFPSSTWTFETSAAIASLSLDDRRTGRRRALPLLEAHDRWLRATALDPTSEVPIARMSRSGRPVGPPRGCDLSWRVALLAHVDAERARALHRRFVDAHWRDHGLVAGFAEWSDGGAHRPDDDSGPVILGIGGAATALGLSAMLAVDDEDHLARMDELLAERGDLLPLLLTPGASATGRRVDGMYDHDERYVTGFLYGDATLFYSLSWHPLPG